MNSAEIGLDNATVQGLAALARRAHTTTDDMMRLILEAAGTMGSTMVPVFVSWGDDGFAIVPTATATASASN